MSLFDRLAYLATYRRRLVLGISLIVVLAGLALAPVFQSNLRGVGYDTPGTDSYRAAQFIAASTGYTERDTLVVHSTATTSATPRSSLGWRARSPRRTASMGDSWSSAPRLRAAARSRLTARSRPRRSG